MQSGVLTDAAAGKGLVSSRICKKALQSWETLSKRIQIILKCVSLFWISIFLNSSQSLIEQIPIKVREQVGSLTFDSLCFISSFFFLFFFACSNLPREQVGHSLPPWRQGTGVGCAGLTVTSSLTGIARVLILLFLRLPVGLPSTCSNAICF